MLKVAFDSAVLATFYFPFHLVPCAFLLLRTIAKPYASRGTMSAYLGFSRFAKHPTLTDCFFSAVFFASPFDCGARRTPFSCNVGVHGACPRPRAAQDVPRPQAQAYGSHQAPAEGKEE